MSIRVFISVIIGFASACAPTKGQIQGQQQQAEEHSGAISGVVVNERGQPVAGAKVSAEMMGVPTVSLIPFVDSDAAGRFTFDGLDWGKYAVCARKEDDGYAEICRSLLNAVSGPTPTLSAQSPRAEVLVAIGPKAGVMTGTVKDALTGAPVDGTLLVRLSKDNGRLFGMGISPQFRVLLPPELDLELEVRAPGYQLWRFSVNGDSQGSPLHMKSEEKRGLDIRLQPDPH